jgi:hypothetical protein
MAAASDVTILRDLAARYADVCRDPVQEERRALWRRHNSLKKTRPLIYTRAFAFQEMPQAPCVCVDPFFQGVEAHFRHDLFWHSLNDDSIFEPWVTVAAVKKCYGWGVTAERRFSGEARGSFKIDYPIKTLDDVKKLRVPWHAIDEEKTADAAMKLEDAIGDLIAVNVDRGPAHQVWSADLSTDLGYLRGIEHFMVDMLDHPEWLHKLVGFMSRGVLKDQNEAETAGDYGLCNHQNQAMAYAEELPDPAANRTGVSRKQLWCFTAAQELTAVSPAMHEEFLLRYQLPIMSQFGLSAYGCCEDLTHKIDMLRRIPNLRRIAVSPFANVARCAEQIRSDYVLSYRPSPTDMVGYGYDETRIRRILERDLAACKGCHVDITLKDVETVQGDPDRVRRWVRVAREIGDSILG